MKWYLAICLAAVALMTVGCNSGGGGFSSRSSGSDGGKIFRYPMVTNPTSLDPHMVEDGDTIDGIQQVFETLVKWDENSKVVPNLCESWSIGDDQVTYTFILKKGVKFHSGREMKAADVKWSFERAATPALASPTTTTYLSDILGVNDMYNGKATEISGIKVIDDYTLAITIDKPRAYFVSKLTYLTAAVVDKDKVPADKPISSPDQMVGTGPFTCSEFTPELKISFKAFKDYHGGAPKIDGIERPVIKDPVTRLNKYKSGEIDLVQLERQDVAALQKDEKFKDHLKLFPRPALWYLAMNPLVYKEFQDKRVRQAFAMAIDRQRIVDELLGGINEIGTGIMPPAVLGHRKDAKVLPYDVAKAKALLAEAGYGPGGKQLPTFQLTFREQRPDIQIVAEAIATMLRENLGVKVELRNMEWGAYLAKHNKKEHGFYHMRWAADYLDAENFLSTLLATYGQQNKVGYSNPEFDKLCAEADGILDEARRLELYAKAEDLVLSDAPFVPIYFQRDAELINPRVQGLRESVFGHLPHTTVEMK